MEASRLVKKYDLGLTAKIDDKKKHEKSFKQITFTIIKTLLRILILGVFIEIDNINN